MHISITSDPSGPRWGPFGSPIGNSHQTSNINNNLSTIFSNSHPQSHLSTIFSNSHPQSHLSTIFSNSHPQSHHFQPVILTSGSSILAPKWPTIGSFWCHFVFTKGTCTVPREQNGPHRGSFCEPWTYRRVIITRYPCSTLKIPCHFYLFGATVYLLFIDSIWFFGSPLNNPILWYDILASHFTHLDRDINNDIPSSHQNR